MKINKNRQQKQVIVGQKNINKDLGIKTIPNETFLFVSRLAPDTTVEDLQNYARQNFPEATCETLTLNTLITTPH